MSVNNENTNNKSSKSTWTERFKKMGWAAFLFFFIKGLVWLAIFFGLGKWLKQFFEALD